MDTYKLSDDMDSVNDRQVAVVTDSVAQVPVELAQQLGITVVPLTVQIGRESYLDGVDLVLEDLYRRMRVDKILPTTSAPSPGQVEEIFQACLSEGVRSVLCITLSSKLSATYSVGCTVAEEMMADHPGCRIEVVDSKQGSIAQGFVVMAAAKAAAQGASLSEVRQVADDAASRAGFVITLDTMEYLKLGGRIGKAAYLVGSLIKIKPLISLDEEGVVSSLGNGRGEELPLQAMVDVVAHRVGGCRKLYLGLIEADAREEAAQLEEMVIEQLHPQEIIHTEFTPVMGAHTGPGVVGLGYYYE